MAKKSKDNYGRTWSDAELREFFMTKIGDNAPKGSWKVGLEETTKKAQANKKSAPERGSIAPSEIGGR